MKLHRAICAEQLLEKLWIHLIEVVESLVVDLMIQQRRSPFVHVVLAHALFTEGLIQRKVRRVLAI